MEGASKEIKEKSYSLVCEILKTKPDSKLVDQLLTELSIPKSSNPIDQLDFVLKHIELSSSKGLL